VKLLRRPKRPSVLTTDITDRDVVCPNVLEIVDEPSLIELHRQDTVCSQLPVDTWHLHPKIGSKLQKERYEIREQHYTNCAVCPLCQLLKMHYIMCVKW